jgi:hypothetical protein
MGVSQPRSRIVYFRLSEQEFCQLVKACEAAGERSVSELVRCAVKRVLAAGAQQDDLSRLNASVQALTRVVKALQRELRKCSDTQDGDVSHVHL